MDEIVGVEMIKQGALRIYDWIEVLKLDGTKEYFVQPDFVQKTVQETPNRSYCRNDDKDTLIFILDGEMYAAPSTESLLNALTQEEFTAQPMPHIPCSVWDGSLIRKHDGPKRWNALCQSAQARRRDEFVQKCRQYCIDNQLGGDLSPDVLKRCLKIPVAGLHIERPRDFWTNGYYAGTFYSDCDYTYFPQVPFTRHNLDEATMSSIGRYNCRNHITVFNTNDAQTFITANEKVINQLALAGHRRENSLIVPLSNGDERISLKRNPDLRHRWECELRKYW